MDEIWLDIEGYPGYRVSSLGRVKSPKKILSPGRVNGYPRYEIRKNGRAVYIRAHILVCTAFNGPKPFEGALCLHRDDDKDNNVPDNVYWGNHKENEEDKKTNNKVQLGEDHHSARFNWDVIRQIRQRHTNGESQLSLASEFEVSQSHIYQIVHNKIWVE